MAYQSYNLPVSVKGIVFQEGKVWLRYNQRNEWELPGGKMDQGEQPEETCARELSEELGFKVTVDKIIQAHLYVIPSSEDESGGVLVISYLCNLEEKTGGFESIGEAGEATFKKFRIEEVADLEMPEFYKLAIQTAWKDTNG